MFNHLFILVSDVIYLKGGGEPSRAVVLVMVTTTLALRESLAQEKSGVGTLSIIHHLHLVYIKKNGKRKSFVHFTADLQGSLE